MKTHTPTRADCPDAMERRVLEAVQKSWAMPKYSARAFSRCVAKGWLPDRGYLELTKAGRTALTRAQGVTEEKP
jgi:hypothetical protein